MNIWIITVGEPIPDDGENVRLHRSGSLALFLARNGHKVHWINSTFDHIKKESRFSQDQRLMVNENLCLHLLKTKPYKNNISVQRLISNFILGFKFKEYSKRLDIPDRILVSYPTIELAFWAVLYGKKHKVKTIVDVRDLWPDIFLRPFKSSLQKTVIRQVLFPYFKAQKYVFKNADSLISISQSMLTWCQSKYSRHKIRPDTFFPFAYNKPSKESVDNIPLPDFLKQIDRKKKVVCFFGNIALPTCRLSDILLVEERAPEIFQQYVFVLCGQGVSYDYYRERFINYNNIILPGFVNKNSIRQLMTLSSAGIIPYEDSFDFRLSIPNKVIEYLSSGLPVLSSLSGETEALLESNNLGITYKNGEDLVKGLEHILLNDLSLQRQHIQKYFLENFESDYVHQSFLNHIVN